VLSVMAFRLLALAARAQEIRHPLVGGQLAGFMKDVGGAAVHGFARCSWLALGVSPHTH